MKINIEFIVVMLLAVAIASSSANVCARGFGGYHGGGFHGGGGVGYAGGAFRGYHGGFGVGGMYEGALDGPRGFSGYGTNWSGFRGGYGLGTASGFQGGYNLGYAGSGGLEGFDNHTRLGPWSRGVAGWRGELGAGGRYRNLGYGIADGRPSQRGAQQINPLPRFPNHLQVSRAFGLPTDLNLHQASRAEHHYGYQGNERGLTALDPQRADYVRPAVATPRIADATRNAGAVTHYWPEADLRRRGNIIRNTMLAEAAFGPSWYDDYAGAWIAPNIVGDLWTPAPWETVNSWFGSNWPAVGYNYGTEITYNNGNVNLYGVPIATTAEYAQSAAALAAKGSQVPAKNTQWLPFGVYAAVRGNEQKSNMLMQLAVDKAGFIRGNYFNTADKNAQQIQGAVDKQKQRVTWIVKDRPNIVFDTSLYNLTKPETTVLVHFGTDKTEQWTIVHLKQHPDQGTRK